jgi:hypothetical protein
MVLTQKSEPKLALVQKCWLDGDDVDDLTATLRTKLNGAFG